MMGNADATPVSPPSGSGSLFRRGAGVMRGHEGRCRGMAVILGSQASGIGRRNPVTALGLRIMAEVASGGTGVSRSAARETQLLCASRASKKANGGPAGYLAQHHRAPREIVHGGRI